MAKETNADKSMTQSEAERMMAPFELDLVAFFKQLRSEVEDILYEGVEEGKTPDEIIAEIEALFQEGGTISAEDVGYEQE